MNEALPITRTWVPFEPLEKGDQPDSELLGRVRGIVSSETVDEDGELIVQDGIDWEYFKSHGFLTAEHPLGVLNPVGYPVSIWKSQTEEGHPATGIDADLYLETKLGKAIWDNSKIFKKAGGNRRYGYSIEGEATERDSQQPHKITKSRVISVAITPAPKNTKSWFDPVIASMAANLGISADAMFRAQVGYPPQAQNYTSDFEALARQSFQGAQTPGGVDQASYPVSRQAVQHNTGGENTYPDFHQKLREFGLEPDDIFTALALKKMPWMNWTQGQAVAETLRGSGTQE